MKSYNEFVTEGVRYADGYDAAQTHYKDLKKHKRLGLKHPVLGRIPTGADLAGAETEVNKRTFIDVKDLGKS